ncbi:cytochrome P450 [Kitasatospora sp. McL0602]|uniref:cytochrome P450 n=1 Tax=Kitasatospora sp. McL0602 TaxID=3439530 RepID=UPI003F8B6642
MTHPADAALYALMSPEGQRDPVAAYAALREAAPVHLNEGGCFVSGYDAASEVLFGEKFGTADPEWFDRNQPGWREHPLLLHIFSSLVGANPPDHTRLRGLVSKAFNVRRVELLRPHVAELTERALDAMAERAAAGQPVDLPAQLAMPVAIGTVARLLGVPAEDTGPFDGWVRKCGVVFEAAVAPEALAEADTAYTAILDYFTGLVAARRKEPADDLVSALIATRDGDGDRLTEQELVDLLAFVFAAGFETTAGLVGNSVVALADNPDQLALLRRLPTTDPQRIGPATDELARLGGSVQVTRRLALTDVELGGVRIPAGVNVVVFLAAANRDPLRFADPDRLDLLRADARPLSYGLGVHYCLGGALARMELEEVLGRLHRRFPDLRLAGTPVRAPGLALNRYESIPVTLS